MDITPYKVTEIAPLVFSFISEGEKGKVEKLVKFQPFQKYLGVFNLAFGDRKSEETLEIDDKNITNNGDIIKVIATVIQTIPRFFAKNSNATLIFSGSDSKRMNLYHRILRGHYKEFEKDFIISGIEEDSDIISLFEPSKRYQFFLIEKINENE